RPVARPLLHLRDGEARTLLRLHALLPQLHEGPAEGAPEPTISGPEHGLLRRGSESCSATGWIKSRTTRHSHSSTSGPFHRIIRLCNPTIPRPAAGHEGIPHPPLCGNHLRTPCLSRPGLGR